MNELLQKKWIAGSLLFLGVWCLGLFPLWISANTLAEDSATEESGGVVKGQTKQGYAFMSGGVGASERAQMEKQAEAYNLKFSFATTSGQYIAKVGFAIRDGKGQEIIETTTDGPWFYIKLPPGKYTIVATFAGNKKEIKDLQVGASKLVARHFNWKMERS